MCIEVAILTILYLIVYGLNMLYRSSSTTNKLDLGEKFVLEKEYCQQD